MLFSVSSKVVAIQLPSINSLCSFGRFTLQVEHEIGFGAVFVKLGGSESMS